MSFYDPIEQGLQDDNSSIQAWPTLSDPLMNEITDISMPRDADPIDSLLFGQSADPLNWDELPNICEMTGDFRGWFSLGEQS